MKLRCAALLIGVCAVVPSANATLLEIDIANPDTFAFDVVWGATSEESSNWHQNWWPNFNDYAVIAQDSAYVVQVNLVINRWPAGVLPVDGTLQFWFVAPDPIATRDSRFSGDRSFVAPSITGTQPSSVTAIDGGYGARVVYGIIPADFPAGFPEGWPFDPLPGSSDPPGGNNGSGDNGGTLVLSDSGNPLLLLGASLAGLGSLRFLKFGKKLRPSLPT
jgi:hypothetical protein